MNRKKVAIVGATGAAGQQLVQALSGHPLFEVVTMVTSKSVKSYKEALRDIDGSSRWYQSVDIPDDMMNIPVISPDRFSPESVDVIFTAVESDLAKELEPNFARYRPTFSTASAFRYEKDTPLIIPGINEEHADLIRTQQRLRGWQGFLLPLPNCTVIGLAISLKPLLQNFGVNRVLMVAMQSVSGAGRSPGVRSLDILDNIIPYIPKEEWKIKQELLKILGRHAGDRVIPGQIEVDCICTRANVLDGHTQAVFAGLINQVDVEDVKTAFGEYNPFMGRDLFSAPQEPIHVFEDPFRPQVRLDRERGDGMTVSLGHIEGEPVLNGVKYILVSHNTRLGAGKGLVLLAECLAERSYI